MPRLTRDGYLGQIVCRWPSQRDLVAEECATRAIWHGTISCRGVIRLRELAHVIGHDQDDVGPFGLRIGQRQADRKTGNHTYDLFHIYVYA
jgi:hypothetical protein